MKKKFVSVLLALTMSTTLSAGLTSTVFAEEAVSTASECSYDGGSGTQEDPYQISSTDSFLTFAANVNDGSNAGYADTYFLLTNDLDLTGIDWEPIGNMNDMENHSTLFLGSFDGGDHTISNLKYESDKYNCGAGLFGVNCGEVKNLTVENAEVTVTDGTSLAIGGVVGYISGSRNLKRKLRNYRQQLHWRNCRRQQQFRNQLLRRKCNRHRNWR